MKKTSKNIDALAPKPVRPIAVRTHGLFGIPFVNQHMVVDKHWTPSSLTEEFKGMTDLLAKRIVALKLEKIAERKRTVLRYRTLRNLCKNGRQKLQMVLYGSNAHNIRNFLIGHKELQRLYQSMPVHLVVDNINQRTFVMRKERDRLRYRLGQLENKYKNKLVERATVGNRIKYQNEFILVEEIKAWELRKKIENSKVRLKAIKTINGTYNKMLQVLKYDSIFFEPILQSLDNDISDQGQFIKHILYIGMPAIAKFKELREEYRIFEERIRKDLQGKLQLLASYKAAKPNRASQLIPKPKAEPIDLNNRYVRETSSMIMLKNELENIEGTIKLVKMATLCSQAKEIFPRIKSQMENNDKLYKRIEKDILGHETVQIKMKRAQVLQGLLINNLSDEEKARQEKIQQLQEQIRKEDEIEATTMAYLKNRADAYVLLRFSLWNLFDMLRNVDRPSKPAHIDYSESYLKLPLLKFEMLNMRAVPPPAFETKVEEIMNVVKRKVQKLMAGVSKDLTLSDMDKYHEMYHQQFVENAELDELSEEGPADAESDELLDAKAMQGIPNRKQLKTESAKIVDELSKKDE